MILPDQRAPEPVRVLVIEQDRGDAERCLRALERAGLEIQGEIVEFPEEFADRLRTSAWDVVLADYQLPAWTGLEALRLLRDLGLDTPLILVTGTLGEERAVECLKEGVADYVFKQNLTHLPVAVRRALEERRARRERASAEDLIRKLSLAVDQSPASVIITDIRGTIQYVNQRFVQITGFSEEEALGRTPRLLKSGETPVELYHDLWRTIRSGQVWHGEIRNRRKDGAIYWDGVTISPIRDAEGTVTHFLATQEDITERRRSEEALKESEARHRKLIEASFDGIDITQGGVILEANQGLADMFGYTLEEVIGRPVADLVAEESRELALGRIEGQIEGRYELVGKRKDGRKILLEAIAKTHEIGGRPARVSALRDVTERRTLEEQFRQAQKMEAVGRLAGGVAHDFNNLLTVITSYTDLVVHDLPADDPRREDLEQILKAAADAATLTRQLLAFSRQQVIEPRLVVLEDVVAVAAKMLARLLGEDIELVTVLSETPLTIKMDPGQIEQIIMNLAVNARDALPDGGKVTIETARVDFTDEYVRTHGPAVPGQYAMLAMTDTGVGMDAQTRARIFEPFFTTKEVGKGTGLGLATVYGIVKQNDGFVWVYSEPGYGATFKIYLPLSELPAPPAGPRAPSPKIPTGTEAVLVVEDAPPLRAAVRQILKRYGYRVLEAPNGKAAMRYATDRAQSIDLLLTDVVMPDISGRQLAEAFTGLRPDAKVLFMSGYTDDAVLRHGMLQPGMAYLQKPFTPETLARKLRDLLDSS